MDSELGDVWTRADQLIVGHHMAPPSYRGRPALLSNGMYLNVQIALRVARNPARLETLASTFTYQAGSDLDDPRPVFEYHYQRDSAHKYPRCHLHIHAEPGHYPDAKPFPRLHLPTRRITLEQIVWHLIHEHHVQPRRPDWHHVLWRHETHVRDTQRSKDWPYDLPFHSPV